MAAEADICNLALSHLGDEASVASISPPDGSAQAVHCARFYPMARDTMLTRYSPTWATRREVLAPLVLPAVLTGVWAYAYAAPANLLKVLDVRDPADIDYSSRGMPYVVESDPSNGAQWVLTDQPGAVVRYIIRVTDSSKFDPLFIDSLAWQLAGHLAGPIVKGDTGAKRAQECYSAANAALAMASAADANQRRVTPEHRPAWIAAR